MVSSRSSNSLTGMQMFLGLKPHRTSDYLEFVTLKDITTVLSCCRKATRLTV